MDPVKFGLVGYGFGGRYFHASLIAVLEAARVSVERRTAIRAGAGQ